MKARTVVPCVGVHSGSSYDAGGSDTLNVSDTIPYHLWILCDDKYTAYTVDLPHTLIMAVNDEARDRIRTT